MSLKKKIALFFAIVSVPFSFFFIPFFCGYFFLSEMAVMWVLPCFLFGPPIVGFIAARSVPTTPVKRAFIGIIAMFLLWASFPFVPGGADVLTLGISTRFRMETNPGRVQQWATRILDGYEAGTFEAGTNCVFFGRAAALNDLDVPAEIKNIWPLKPSVGIAAFSDDGLIRPIRTNTATMPQLTGGRSVPIHLTHCVVICWAAGTRGFLVGRPDFESTWDPTGGSGFMRRVMPGIYAFCVGN